jgi:hypothetical protein
MNSPRLVFALAESPGFHRIASQQDGWATTVPIDAQGLSFELTGFGDEAFIELKRFNELRCLDLDGTRVTDKSMSLIASLPMLEELWLEETSVTDAGLQALSNAPRLRFISVAYTAVTDAGIRSLVGLRPELEVAT